MYTITPHTFRQAKKMNLKVMPSRLKNKKIDVFTNSGEYITSVGMKGYGDYGTFFLKYGKQYADERRKLYKMRHRTDRLKRGTPGYYADKLLW